MTGGPGCGVSGHVGFGNKECCPNGVVANQEDCAVTGTAPCVITEESSLLPGRYCGRQRYWGIREQIDLYKTSIVSRCRFDLHRVSATRSPGNRGFVEFTHSVSSDAAPHLCPSRAPYLLDARWLPPGTPGEAQTSVKEPLESGDDFPLCDGQDVVAGLFHLNSTFWPIRS